MLRKAAITASAVGACAILFSWLNADNAPVPVTPGKNNTVLFVTNEHDGLYNVHLSTLYSLLENDSPLDLHFASFPKAEKRVQHVSNLAASGKANPKAVNFYSLPGLSYTSSMLKVIPSDAHSHPPGLASGDRFLKSMGVYISPWSVEDYYDLYEYCGRLIDEIDPAVIVLDSLIGPAIDATRQKNRLHAIVTPNVLSDLLPAGQQPPWTLFWKYPAMGSGFPYPVPWKLIPANIYINIQIIRGILNMPDISAKRKVLREKGIKKPIDFMGLYRPDVPWITQTLPGAHLPIGTIAQNVTLAGPINLAGIEKKSSKGIELLQWASKPTLLVCLGSGFKYHEWQARVMLEAIQSVLKQTDAQVLWKMAAWTKFDDSFLQFLEAAVKDSAGRLRIENWLDVEPPTLLQEANILAFVHHGGAGCFHDALGAGVRQVILPQWVDLYDYATLVEGLGIGTWGCRETSPDWTAECLQDAFLLSINGSDVSASMAKNAAAFGDLAKSSPGRDVAARAVEQLAASGHA